MKIFLAIIFSIFFLNNHVNAQGIADPTSWSYEVKKLDRNEYELIFHVILKEGWHIFSQKPGDEYLIPPTFNFEENKNIKLLGPVIERGKLISTTFEGVDSLVNYYEGQVDFIQKVHLTGNCNITGEQQYQVCNDRLCLPPKKKKFEFEVK